MDPDARVRDLGDVAAPAQAREDFRPRELPSLTRSEMTLMTVTVPCPFCSTLNRVALDRVDDGPRCGQCTRPILLDRPLAVSDASFEQVIGASEVPVVVDFYADWCGPCRVMAPVLDQLAHDRRGDLLVLKLNTDQNQSTAGRYDVRSIPTLIVFERGQPVARESGAMPRGHLDALLARAAS